MEFQKITIVFIPQGSTRVRKIRIQKFFPFAAMLFLLFFIIVFFILVREYRSIIVQMPRLALLERERKAHLKHLSYLELRVKLMKGDLGRLSELDQRLRLMLNPDEGWINSPVMGIGGSPPQRPSPPSGRDDFKATVRNVHQSLDTLRNRCFLMNGNKAELIHIIEKHKILLDSTPSIWPVRGWLSSSFGYRKSPFTGEREFHKGVDISAKMETAVVAPSDGLIITVCKEPGYGNTLKINHGFGLTTRFAHLEKSLVKPGQQVKRGQRIACVGNTGRSTGPHLHYEVLHNGIPVDPLRYIAEKIQSASNTKRN